MIYKSFIIVIVLGLGLVSFSFVLAQTGPSQAISPDAIGLRVVPNPEHFSPLAWYLKNIKIQGSPQSMMVDGYDAVRDGRTVYVNAANIGSASRCSDGQLCTRNDQCASGPCQTSTTKELYTNIYIISYNQNPDNSTIDILGQILQYWKFNIDIKNCSLSVTQTCVTAKECPPKESCGPTGFCNKTNDKKCIIDADCPQGEYCNSKKSTIVRDTKRLIDLQEFKNKIAAYYYKNKTYPKLESGTYLTNRTISVWPSWSATFGSEIGYSLPVDPVNKLGKCKLDDNDNARFDPTTCWDDKAKEFAGLADPLTLPDNSRAYFYQTNPAGNSFNFCSIIESGYIQAKPALSPLCYGRCNNFCSTRQCGDDGCGGSCGTCPSGKTCTGYKCVISGG